MGNLLAPHMTPKQMMDQSKNELRKAIRELDRERIQLQLEEKKSMRECKLLAKQGQMEAAKILAKNMVRTRVAVKKFYSMIAQLQATLVNIQTMSSTATIAEAMKKTVRAMYRMNQSTNLPQLQKIMQTFEKESEIMEMKQEMMDDTLNDAVEGDEEEESQVLNQILDEIGINTEQMLGKPPKNDEMQDRLEKLKAK